MYTRSKKGCENFFTWNTVSMATVKLSKLADGLPSRKLKAPPKSCMPSSAKISMKRKRRNSNEIMERIELSNDITRFLSDDQYLDGSKYFQLETLSVLDAQWILIRTSSLWIFGGSVKPWGRIGRKSRRGRQGSSNRPRIRKQKLRCSRSDWMWTRSRYEGLGRTSWRSSRLWRDRGRQTRRNLKARGKIKEVRVQCLSNIVGCLSCPSFLRHFSFLQSLYIADFPPLQ